MTTTTDKTAAEYGLFAGSYPCNPKPFLHRLLELVDQGGTDAIKTDQAKACLNVLLGQSYGQLFRVDSLDEYFRLSKILNPD